MKKIAIIEDDIGIQSSLRLYLENSDFQVVTYSTGNAAIDFIFQEKPDLIILDVNLPDKDGIQICRELRNDSLIPIIMLTARNSESDKISGLDVGADDYIAKPFSPRELLARIQSILRRTSKSEEASQDKNTLTFGNIKILLDSAELEVSGSKVELTKNEFDILEMIAKAKGALVTRESLMKDVIGYSNYVYDRTIDTHIKNLRKKIGNKEQIVTVRGKGYRMNV